MDNINFDLAIEEDTGFIAIVPKPGMDFAVSLTFAEIEKFNLSIFFYRTPFGDNDRVFGFRS